MNHNPIQFAQQIAHQLTKIYEHTEEQQQVAWWLLEAVTGFDTSHLIAQKELLLSQEQQQILTEWLDKHINQHMPLQYILGWVPFGPLKIFVQPPVLIPRPETEEWSLQLAKQLSVLKNTPLNILDLCTGTGCIALLLAYSLPHATILGTDISQEALELAEQNRSNLKLSNVSFVRSDLFSNIGDRQFDVIVSNPPYISDLEWDHLDLLVKKWEDHDALVAPDNGLAIIQRIINQSPRYLKHNEEMKKKNIPMIYIEFGYSQAKEVKRLMEEAQYNAVHIEKDLEGKDRLISARLKEI